MEKRSSATRNWLIVVAVLIVAGVAAYFAGGFVERTASAQRYNALETQLASEREQYAHVEAVNRLLAANVWAYRAAGALDNRNFGVASDAVAKVVANLNALDAAAAGLDGGSVAAVKKEAAGVRISVTANLESQRIQILHLASAVAALVGKTATKENSAR